MGTVLIIYCLAWWAAGLVLWRFKLLAFEPCEAEQRCPPEVARLAHWLAFVSAPVWLAVIGAAVVWFLLQDVVLAFRYARLRRKCRVYQEYRFRPVNYLQLDRETRACFARSTAELFPLGFRPLGDYQLKEQPVSMIDRFFWRDDGTVLAVASFIDAIDRSGSVVLISWLADGVCVQTSAIEDDHADPPPDPDIDLLETAWAGELSAADLMTRHVQHLAALARQRQTEILAFESAQLEPLVISDQRRFHHWLHRLGKGTLPPAPVLPTAAGRLSPDELLLTFQEAAVVPASSNANVHTAAPAGSTDH